MLQQDLYILRVNNGITTYLGNFNTPTSSVEERYIGFKNNMITILGIAKKGEIIQLRSISQEYAPLAGTFNCFGASLINSKNQILYNQLNAIWLVNERNNPPFTSTWSDPPIFDPKYALPLPSDGIWWK